MDLVGRLLGRRGTGCLADVPDERDLPFDRMGLSALGIPATATLRHHVPQVLDQLSTESCVAHAVCAAIQIDRRAHGESAPLPSRLFAYFNSRASHGAAGYDLGTYPRACVKMLAKFGAPPEEAWAFTARQATVNQRPSWGAYRQAYDHRGPRGYYRIFDTGQNRVDAVRAAIAAGHPVVFGAAVDEAFTRMDGPVVIGPPYEGRIVGRHAMVVVGYTDDNRFEVLNSWGERWRDSGFWWMSEDYLRWQDVDDLQVIDAR